MENIYNKLVLPWHYLKGVVAGVVYGFPARGMKVVAVTGTNGKTTTCFMIWKMLLEAGIKTGIATTIGYGVKEVKRQKEHMTTVSPFELNRRIKEMKKEGAKVLVLEVTSHALVQKRTMFIPFNIGVMTNITRDHLDYHRTFKNYMAAKMKLFKKAKFAVFNEDDMSAKEIKKIIGEKKYVSYGIKSGNKRAFGVKNEDFGIKYAYGDIFSGESNKEKKGLETTDEEKKLKSEMKKSKEMVEVELMMPGMFNVYNSLAAICVGEKLGLDEKKIAKGLRSLEVVPGRMNLIEGGQDFKVVVDYAHTPDAFLKIYEAMEVENLRKNGSKIITVTGGAGRRDSGTRKERGEIAGRFSDVLIITEDDSRDEDAMKIAKMFVEGAKKAGMREVLVEELGKEEREKARETARKKVVKTKIEEKIKKNEKIVKIIIDRKKAILEALKMAKKNDVVLILGKGHEQTILKKEGEVEFDDVKVAKEILENNY